MTDLIAKEQSARRARKDGDLAAALRMFHDLASERPDFEHGAILYEIATIYEDIGSTAEAEEYYRRAVTAYPENPIYLGGLASFLYSKGKPDDALRLYLQLYQMEAPSRRRALLPAIEALALRTGLSEEAVTKMLLQSGYVEND